PPTQAIGSLQQPGHPPTQAIAFLRQPQRKSAQKRFQPVSDTYGRNLCADQDQKNFADTEKRPQPQSKSLIKSFLKKSYLIPLSCLLPVAGMAFTFILVLGVLVLWLLPSGDDSQDTSVTAAGTPAPQAKRQPGGKKAAASAHRGETGKVSRCLIIYPKQMRKPDANKQFGSLYAFSSYLDSFEKRAKGELSRGANLHKTDLAKWKRTADYKRLQARAAFYKGREREKIARAYGRICYIKYEKNNKATLQLKNIGLSQAEQERRFADDGGFEDCGLKIGQAQGTFDEKKQIFTGEGVVWDISRGGKRQIPQERTVKIRISPKSAYWGDRVFDVYVEE
ncbi:MAG: hypothetical protein Q4F00_14075, partial [bacterium]|nr:hypothetical protein [bacterium]